jgi:predicted aspartyl protease
MQLKKVAQSLIKGPILTSEASPCFTVPLIVKMDSNSIIVHTLLDSGASACFMDKDFVNYHKLPLITNKHPIIIEVIDKRPLISGDVIHETTPLDIVIDGHHNIIAFNVIKSPSNPVVLGLSWLDKYSLVIDWKTQRLIFRQELL